MAKSLMDQLLKAGLVDAHKVSSVNKEKKKQEKQQRKGQIETVDETKQNVQQALAEKGERDRQLNFERDEQARHKAIIAQIKQLIETSQLSRERADIAYNFTDGTKIKKIFVTDSMLNQLSNGRLAIVKFEEQYSVVPKSVAEKIKLRDEKYVVVSNVLQQTDDADDPYAEYKIPDDLMW
ncbi:MAG: nucleoprotein/polynucleotide-associated enzyme [Verrucomicrobiaceae bacterium]|nr:nucleoprotein/polynucleotide-associated enzyme [Verrucomicrobiaceae bacterium]